MLTELRMKVEAKEQGFGYYQSSNLQGVLMERIDVSYAGKLHEQGRKPYSQYLSRGEDGSQEWVERH